MRQLEVLIDLIVIKQPWKIDQILAMVEEHNDGVEKERESPGPKFSMRGPVTATSVVVVVVVVVGAVTPILFFAFG